MGRSPMLRSALPAIALAAVAALGIGVLQPGLAKELATVRQRTDIHELPPPEHLQRLALGYKSQLVDLLWAKLLVEQGLHWQEKRRFDEMPSYIEGIIALEPGYRTIYEFVDTLLLYQYIPGGEKEARLARGFLEQGLKALPYDPRIWEHYGQFLAFFAPSFLTDKAEIEDWRKAGAFALMHAVELGADAQRSLAASTILDKAGERKAAVAALQRNWALTDDPEQRRQIRIKLERMESTVEAESTVGPVEELWRKHWPFLSRGETLLIGPVHDTAACAGQTDDPKCALNWR